MKTRAALFIVLALALLALPGPARAAGAHPDVGAPPLWGSPTNVAAPAGLRLRVGPGLSEPIIFVLAHGETVTPGGAPTWNDGLSWTFVRVYRWGRWYEGFCASRYLGTASGAQGSLRVVAPAGLNLRWGPGTGYGVARCLPYGTLVRPTGIYQWGDGVRWTQVQYGGHYYWAAASWLRSA